MERDGAGWEEMGRDDAGWCGRSELGGGVGWWGVGSGGMGPDGKDWGLAGAGWGGVRVRWDGGLWRGGGGVGGWLGWGGWGRGLSGSGTRCVRVGQGGVRRGGAGQDRVRHRDRTGACPLVPRSK